MKYRLSRSLESVKYRLCRSLESDKEYNIFITFKFL